MLKNFKELYTYRALLFVFVYRDLKARYKHTVIGIVWAIIQPLFLMFVFTMVFSHFFKVGTDGVPYPVFSYVALLPWTFISKALTTSGIQFVGNRGLITKIYFPREIIPLSTVLSGLIDFFFGSFVFLAMLVYYGIPLTPAILFVFLLLPIQILLASGLAFISSAAMALFRDLQFAMPLFSQLWMYGSPIIYSAHNLQKRFQVFFYLNPVTGIVDGYRDAIIHGKIPDLGYFVSSATISVLLFFLGYWIFKRLEYFIVDIM